MTSETVLAQAPETAGPEAYKRLYRTFAAGVAVVTSDSAAGPVGMTASSVIAVSVTPPLILVSFSNHSRTLKAIRGSRRFAINLLTEGQHHLAERFASQRPGWAKFSDVELSESRPPVFASALATVVCEVGWIRQTGDHTLLLGEIDRAIAGDGLPLIWHASDYYRVFPRPSPMNP
jgi:flavin reductase (DIM6/NTAB) family NADH-FMN oxidoreductase RutF